MSKSLIEILKNKKIILASSSKSRQELLNNLDINIIICPPNFEENLKVEHFNTISEFVEATAWGKMNEVYERLKNENPDVVIGADTVVTYDKIVYGKPKNKKEAVEFLQTLNGNTNVVYTGVVLKIEEKIKIFTETTSVHIGNMTDDDIIGYVESGEPLNKAGSYAIQGKGGNFIEKIEGNYQNILGLPMYRILNELKNFYL